MLCFLKGWNQLSDFCSQYWWLSSVTEGRRLTSNMPMIDIGSYIWVILCWVVYLLILHIFIIFVYQSFIFSDSLVTQAPL